MRMSIIALAFTLFTVSIACKNNDSAIDNAQPVSNPAVAQKQVNYDADIITGAQQTELLLPLIKGKYIACCGKSNQTQLVINTW
jgi:hypothetical protein